MVATAHLDQSVLFNVVFESPQLQVQNRRERLEDDTLLSILQTVSFRLVLVLPIQSLHLNVIEERVAKGAETLDGKLDV